MLPYSINAAITNNQRDSYIKNKAVVPTSGVIDSLGVSYLLPYLIKSVR